MENLKKKGLNDLFEGTVPVLLLEKSINIDLSFFNIIICDSGLFSTKKKKRELPKSDTV